MRRLIALVPFLAWASSVGAASSPDRIWKPNEPFKLSPTKDRCIAVSSFKRGDRTMLVALEGNPAAPGYELRLYVPGALRRWDEGKYSLGLVKLKSDSVFVRSGSQPSTMIYLLGISKAELKAAGSSPILRMHEIVSPGEITLSELVAAMPMIDACASEFLERWGYSKEQQRGLASLPKIKKDWTSYVSSQDYPMQAQYSGAGGETRLLIDVGANGKGSNCRIIRPSGRNDLDQMSCRIVTERAEYDPGRNANGEAVRAPYYVVFRWEFHSP